MSLEQVSYGGQAPGGFGAFRGGNVTGREVDSDGYGVVCHGCGGRIVKARPESVWFEWQPGVGKRSWHWACRPGLPGRRAKLARSAGESEG